MVVFFKHYILESVELQQSVSVTEICFGILGNFVQVHARKKELKSASKRVQAEINIWSILFICDKRKDYVDLYPGVQSVLVVGLYQAFDEKDHVDPIIRILYNKLLNYDLKALSEATHSAKNKQPMEVFYINKCS